MAKSYLWLLALIAVITLASPAAAQYYAPGGGQVCTPDANGVVLCVQQPPPTAPLGPTTTCTSDGMGVTRCDQGAFGPTTTCTTEGNGVERCDQQPSPSQQQYSTPQPWQQAIPQGFVHTTICTTDGMGVERCN
ncbi:MAG: hypothetical protein WCA81_18650 [Rhizomicrobium sp.]